MDTVDDTGLEKCLDKDKILKLKGIFDERGSPLSDNVIVMKEEADKWVIVDNGKTYIVLKEGEKLSIYKMKKLVIYYRGAKKYDATRNAKKFIVRYFPEKYKEISSLLWDGIRNGLVHTFSPKLFTYKGSCIGFQFYVDDKNFPSHIEKVKGCLFSIDAKLEDALNRGIVPEKLENDCKTMNLPLPEEPTVRKEKKYLFSMNRELENELNAENSLISEGLKSVFKTKGFRLSENATKKKENDYKWVLTDKENIYIVKKEEGKLSTYKKTQWEITDDEGDTFYVLEKEDGKKINVYNCIFQIRINVFELYRVLEKAVEAYRAELENSTVLQNKFIRAWSSIEEYTEKVDSDQSKEVKILDKYLGSNSSALLLKGLNDQLSVDVLKIYSLCSLKIKRS